MQNVADAAALDKVDASTGDEPVAEDFQAIVARKQKDDGMSLADATVAAADENPEAHEAYVSGLSGGK